MNSGVILLMAAKHLLNPVLVCFSSGLIPEWLMSGTISGTIWLRITSAERYPWFHSSINFMESVPFQSYAPQNSGFSSRKTHIQPVVCVYNSASGGTVQVTQIYPRVPYNHTIYFPDTQSTDINKKTIENQYYISLLKANNCLKFEMHVSSWKFSLVRICHWRL